MNVLLFGATGMVGQGVLIECLEDPGVTRVLAVGRRPAGRQHEKLEELLHGDFLDYASVEPRLAGFDACFFCLGTSAAGMSEAAYARVTHDYTLAAASALCRIEPRMTFSYISGAGTDPTENSRMMWARVKGRTESDLARLPFRATYMFRPGFIRPVKGAVSGTRWYRVAYLVAKPLFPLLSFTFRDSITTTEIVGRAMIRVAREGRPSCVLAARDINAAGRSR